MRILYLHQYFVPPQGSGGTRSYEFARRLIAAGHKVLIITSTGYMPAEYQGLTRPTRLDIDGVPIHVIPVAYSNEMSFSQRMRAFASFAIKASAEAAQHRADVIFATSTPLTIAIPGIIARLWHRAPMVFEVRDLWPELPIAMGAIRNPLLRWASGALEWIAYHASEHVIALSPGMADGVVRRGVRRERVTVIPNACDRDRFDVPRSRGDAIRQRLSLSDHHTLVVYTGTFGHINGVGYLVEVAARARQVAPEMRFLLVGSGVEYEAVLARARALGVLDRNLWVWRPVAKAEVPDVLAAADIAVSLFIPLEAMWHNSANKFFDALAAGKPIAINYGGWQADLLKETGAGIALPPSDPEGAAKMLAEFASTPGSLQRAGQAARTVARERFDRDQMAAKLITILERVGSRSKTSDH